MLSQNDPVPMRDDSLKEKQEKKENQKSPKPISIIHNHNHNHYHYYGSPNGAPLNANMSFSTNSASRSISQSPLPVVEKKKSSSQNAMDTSTDNEFELIYLEADQDELTTVCAAAKKKVNSKPNKYSLPIMMLRELWSICLPGSTQEVFKNFSPNENQCGIMGFKDIRDIKVSIMWSNRDIPYLEIADNETGQPVLKVSPQPDGSLNVVKYPSTLWNNKQQEKLAQIFQKNLFASKTKYLSAAPILPVKTPSPKDGKDAKKESSGKRKREEPNDTTKSAKPKIAVSPRSLAEKKKERSLLTISQNEFNQRIKQVFNLPLAGRLSAFKDAYDIKTKTYRFNINLNNERGAPFKTYIKVAELTEFRESKEKGDESALSWIFDNEADITFLVANYKPVSAPGKTKFYEFRVWQQQDDNAPEPVDNAEENARGWIAANELVGELHTIAKTDAKANGNPMPGGAAVSISDSVFSLFGPKTPIFFANSAYRKVGVLDRVWKGIINGKNYYIEQNDVRPSAIAPKKVSLATSLHPPGAQPAGVQDPYVFEKALKNVQAYPLTDFYNLLNQVQKRSLIKLYNKSLGAKAPIDKNGGDEAFKNVKGNLQQLVIAIDRLAATQPACANYDVELHRLICDGVSIADDFQYTKEFISGTPLARFKEWVFEIVWRGYIWQKTLVQTNNSEASSSSIAGSTSEPMRLG